MGEGWFIEINSLDDLLKLQEEVGAIIIQDSYSSGYKEIEIYDDYRE